MVENRDEPSDSPVRERSILKYFRHGVREGRDELCVEEHMRIHINNTPLGNTIHTPGQEEDLVYGLLFSEGVIDRAADIVQIGFGEQAGEKQAEVIVTRDCFRKWNQGRESVPGFAVSKASPAVSVATTAIGWSITPEQLNGAMRTMESAQTLFPRTGGAHCAALFSARLERLAQAEDIGRHNALDKVVGRCLRQGVLREAAVGLMSSRLSWELVRKARRAGLALLAGISAGTSLAVETAEQSGITLVGWVRKGGMTIYSHAHRIQLPEPDCPERPPRVPEQAHP